MPQPLYLENTDIDEVYRELSDIQERIYMAEEANNIQHPVKEVDEHMTKILEYRVTFSDGTVTALRTSPSETISQYQKILLRVLVVGLEDNPRKSVKVSFNTPANYSEVPNPTPKDFEYSQHMTPSTSTLNTFETFISDEIGNNLTVGIQSNLQIMFTINDGGVDMNSNVLTLSMYRTNRVISYAPSDISNIFVALAEYGNRLVKIESKVE